MAPQTIIHRLSENRSNGANVCVRQIHRVGWPMQKSTDLMEKYRNKIKPDVIYFEMEPIRDAQQQNQFYNRSEHVR